MESTPLLYKDAEARLRAGGISRATLFRWTKEGIVPPPVVINKQNFRIASDFDNALLALGPAAQEELAS